MIVEEYCQGTEFILCYTFSDGKNILVEHGVGYGDHRQGIPFVYGEAPTPNIDTILRVISKPLKQLFEDLECKDGIAAVQGIVNKDKIFVFEMNYRLPGIDFANSKYGCNLLLDFVLGEETTDESMIVQGPKYIVYYISLRKGTISAIDGLDTIKEKTAVLLYDIYKKVGDEIQENTGMRQILLRIIFDTEKETVEHAFSVVNDTLVVLDQNGKDMVYRYEYVDGSFVIKEEK